MTKIAFFGSSKFSVFCLEELKTLGILPSLIVSTTDKPTGRGLKLTPTPVKIWAKENNIECLTPEKLDSSFVSQLQSYNSELFLVASYGKIIPKSVIDLPKYGTLNIHPSLLPKYRGPSPLQEQILNDEKNVGVTLMLIDEKMDHGPIIAQTTLGQGEALSWPKLEEFKQITAKIGAKLFADNLNNWINGKIKPIEQNHNEATFTKKVEKADGLIDLETGDPYINFRKIQAYSLWPQAYFFVPVSSLRRQGSIPLRVIIKDADYKDGQLIIKKVLPEGKKEMNYEDFLRGLK
jgi:methionyl-tRNA formyltransferase